MRVSLRGGCLERARLEPLNQFYRKEIFPAEQSLRVENDAPLEQNAPDFEVKIKPGALRPPD